MKKVFFVGAALALLGAPLAAQAQSGTATGATTGAVGGAIVGGPVGAAVGAGVGAIVGGINDAAQANQFRQYVTTQDVQSYRYADEVTVGAVLPAEGVRYYEVPAQYGVKEYRYTVVNNTPVLVEPRTRRIVQVIR